MRILGAVLTAAFGVPFLFFAWLALSGRFGGSDADAHGYGMIFGTLFAVFVSIPLALSVPLVVEKQSRAKAALVSLLVVLLIDVGLFVALASA